MRRLPNPFLEVSRLQLELNHRSELDDAREVFSVLVLCALWFALGFVAAVSWFMLGG